MTKMWLKLSGIFCEKTEAKSEIAVEDAGFARAWKGSVVTQVKLKYMRKASKDHKYNTLSMVTFSVKHIL